MARDFNGTSQRLLSPFSGIGGTPLTFACWFQSDQATTGQVLIFVGNDSTFNGWWLGAFGDQAGDPVGILATLSSTHAIAFTSTGYTVGNWHHACGVFVSGTERTVYIDGGSAVTNTDSKTPGDVINSISIGALFVGGAPSAFFDGRIAEAGIWNCALTPDDVRSLAAGVSPLLVCPSDLIGYLPLIGRASPDLELIQGAVVSNVGAPPAADHCRVVYPSSAFAYSLPAPVAVPLEIQPPVVANPFSVFAPTVLLAGALAPPLISAPFQVFSPTVTVAPVVGDLTLVAPLISKPLTVYAPSVNLQDSAIQEDERELEPHSLKVRIMDFVGGDDLRITRTYTELASGVLISKAYLTIKRHAKDDTDAQAVVQKTITTAEQMSGKILDNDTTGGSIQLHFDLSKNDTALLTPLVPYHYDVQVITTGSAVYTCEKGVIVMQQGVTHTDN